MRTWVLQAERDDGVRHDGPTTDEKTELAQLRRRVRVLERTPPGGPAHGPTPASRA